MHTYNYAIFFASKLTTLTHITNKTITYDEKSIHKHSASKTLNKLIVWKKSLAKKQEETGFQETASTAKFTGHNAVRNVFTVRFQ